MRKKIVGLAGVLPEHRKRLLAGIVRAGKHARKENYPGLAAATEEIENLVKEALDRTRPRAKNTWCFRS